MIISKPNALQEILFILKKYDLKKVMLITGKKSFELSGAKIFFDKNFSSNDFVYFNDFDVNPKYEDVLRGSQIAIDNSIELILCIGGGSVMDMGKLIKAIIPDYKNAKKIVSGNLPVPLKENNIPLIMVPTTAGSGSESTHFAVVYINNKKYSVANQNLLPEFVFLDGNLVSNSNKYQKACNVLDAISQSIESAWAVGSSTTSREISFRALDLCMRSYQSYVNSDTNNANQEMLIAANMAGQAINLSKTTAPHAWSYAISSSFNVPHGHAVWFTLPSIFEIHCSNKNLNLNSSIRKSDFINTINKIKNIIGIGCTDNIKSFFSKMLSSIEIYADIERDIKTNQKIRKLLSESVNVERLENNPVIFSNDDIKNIFKIN